MLDGGLSIYTAMHLYTYVPIWLYSYTPMCLQHPPLGAFVCLVTGFPMRWNCLMQVRLVRGGDDNLAHARVVAPGCAGDGVSRAGKFHPHLAFPHAPPTGYMCRPVPLAKVWVRRRRRVGFLFVRLFGLSSLCPVFSSGVASRLFLSFWFAHVGVRVGQWGV